MALTKVNHRMIDEEVINVLDFEADKTGANDSYLACQNAINQAISEGKSIYFPSGIYKLSNRLVITGATGIDVYGDGIAVTTLKVDGDFTGAFQVYASSDVSIKNMTLDGNASNDTSYDPALDNGCSGITFTNTATSCYIENVEIKQFTKDGIYIGSVAGSHSTTLCQRISVRNCIFKNIRRDCITIIGGNDFIFVENTFVDGRSNTDNVANDGIHYEPNGSDQNLINCIISNNSFSNLEGSGVKFVNYTTATVIQGLIINGNNFYYTEACALILYKLVDEIAIISNNTFDSCGKTTGSGISNNGGAISTEQSERIIIESNYFKNNFGIYATVNNQSQNNNLTQIKNNTFEGDNRRGININYPVTPGVYGSLRQIIGNVMYDGSKESGGTYEAIYISNTASNNGYGDIIALNSIRTNSSSGYGTGIKIEYDNGNSIISGNTFFGNGTNVSFSNGLPLEFSTKRSGSISLAATGTDYSIGVGDQGGLLILQDLTSNGNAVFICDDDTAVVQIQNSITGLTASYVSSDLSLAISTGTTPRSIKWSLIKL